MAVFTDQFLVPFLSTFHSAIIHILKNYFIQTGGKDRGTMLVTKCFLKAKITNGLIAALVCV